MYKYSLISNVSMKESNHLSKIVLILCLLLTFILLNYYTLKYGSQKTIGKNLISNYPNYTEAELEQINKVKECYKLKEPNEQLVFLDDITQSKPKTDKTIFFIDTSCSKNGSRVTLDSRCFNQISVNFLSIF